MEKYCHAAAAPATNVILKTSLLEKTEDRGSGDSVVDGASIGLPLILARSLDNNCLSPPFFFPAGENREIIKLTLESRLSFVIPSELQMILSRIS